jgi:hypothetical protein
MADGEVLSFVVAHLVACAQSRQFQRSSGHWILNPEYLESLLRIRYYKRPRPYLSWKLGARSAEAPTSSIAACAVRVFLNYHAFFGETGYIM